MKKVELSKKMVSLAVASSLSLSMLGTVNGAAGTKDSATDISGHWAEQSIQQWLSQGLIEGYEDGSFQPDKPVSRAEFITLVNRAFGFADTGNASFKDLKTTDWSYSDIQKAVKAGYIAGFQDGTIHPNAPITRQEIALIIGRLLDLAPSADEADVFKDALKIPSWSKGAIGAVQASGIMGGYADDTFKPANKATRAEAVVILEHSLKVKPAPVMFDKAGIYGPETGSQTIKGDVVISVPGVTLQNTIIEGNLTFAAGIGEGDAVLKHVTVNGTTLVQGGGANSIHFEDSVLLTIIVDKAAGTVRIVAEGTTTVVSVLLKTGATLEEDKLTGEGFTDVLLSDLLPADTVVSLLGGFNDVGVSSTKTRIEIPRGSVGQVNIKEKADENKLNLGDEAKIVNFILHAAVKVVGGGTINTVEASKEALTDSTFEKQPEKMVEQTGAVVTPPAPQQPSYNGPTQEQVDQQTADSVTAMIAALPAAADLKLAADKAAVEAANSAFNALTAAQKALVSTENQNKLSNAAARIAELQADKSAADAVMALIAALPEPDAVTLDKQSDVTAAKNALDALAAAQKTSVTNQDKLTQAIAKIDALLAAANDVKDLIAALPDPAAVTLDNQAAVTAAKNALDSLSASQKVLVTNQDKLTQAIAKIDTLTAAANAVKDLIVALPAPVAITLDNQTAVTAAKNALEALAASQKAVVTNQDKLTQALAKIDTLIADANAVKDLIAALPDPAAVTLDNQTAVTAAKNALDALAPSQKTLVTNQDKLTQVLAKIDALTAEANAVKDQITALPDPSAITLDNQSAVNAAKSALDALAASQKTLVTNQDKLTQALAKIETLIADANAVKDLIAALPAPAAITLDNQAAVTAAKNALDSLSTSQKTLVTNQDKLTQILTNIDALIAEANAVKNQIAALPDPAAVTLDNQGAVTAAKNALDALAASQKTLVTNQVKLVQALAKIDALIAAANDVTGLIAALPDPAVVTLDNQTAVTAAKNALDALAESQKVLVTNQDKLTQALAKIDTLITAANAVKDLITALPDPSAITLDNQAAVTAAKNALDALAVSQKTLVTNQDKLTQALAQIDTLIADANAVKDLIAALPEPAALTLDNQEAVTAAKNALDSLSTSQKALVTNQDKLTQALAKIEALITAANSVKDLIAALPEPANLTLAHKTAVNAVNSAYEALSVSQKTLVTNLSKLTDALARIVELENQQAADAVIALIGGLPDPAGLTLAAESSVTAANNAFNALSTVQKALVTNQSKLTDAIARIAELKADKAAADIVTGLIAALPSQLALSDETSITAATNAFNALTTAQKALVTNQNKLTDAVAQIAQLKADQAAADIIVAQIEALPAIENIILANEAAVTAARNAYDNLTPARQALVTNLDKLVQAETRIQQLHLPQSLTSKEIADLNFQDVDAAQARGESITITTDTNFQAHPVSFTVSDGKITVNVTINWNLPVNEFTKGQMVGSVVESYIQQYYNDHHLDLGTRTLTASGYGDKFYISTFATGTQAKVILGGGYSTFFTSNTFSGMDEVIKSRSFTVSDGAITATIYQDRTYTSMDDLVSDINGQLQDANIGAIAEKVDTSHFKLKPSVPNGPVLTIGGADKDLFFSAFQMN